LNQTITQEIKARIDKWYCMKLKCYFTSKETVTRIKKQPIEWEKSVLTIQQISDYYPEYKQLSKLRTNSPIIK
jgi:hypothetical protein